MSLSCKDTGTDIVVSFDQHVIWQGDPGQNKTQQISHEFEDIDGEKHVLRIALSNKLPCHTKVDDQGNIVSDLLVDISQFLLESVNIDQLVWTSATYHHDFNGTQSSTVERFFGNMGCNGQVEFRFTSPAYIWLLENT
jgi:hypothetical protein